MCTFPWILNDIPIAVTKISPIFPIFPSTLIHFLLLRNQYKKLIDHVREIIRLSPPWSDYRHPENFIGLVMTILCSKLEGNCHLQSPWYWMLSAKHLTLTSGLNLWTNIDLQPKCIATGNKEISIHTLSLFDLELWPTTYNRLLARVKVNPMFIIKV